MRVLHWAQSGLPHLVLLFLTIATLLAAPGLAKAIGLAAADDRYAVRISVPLLPFDENSPPPFVLPAADTAEFEQAAHCMSEAVYYEAAFEPLDGQRAIAQVIVNRVRDRNFPSSICEVVYQGWKRHTGCQFSFVCDGSLKRRPPTDEQLAEARIVAEQALTGYVVPEVGTATHYHTTYVDPYWAPTLVEITKIGEHIFYKWPGKAGRATSLQQHYAGGEVRFWRTAAGRLPRAHA